MSKSTPSQVLPLPSVKKPSRKPKTSRTKKSSEAPVRKPRARRPKKSARSVEVVQTSFEKGLTIGLAVTIPLISLVFTRIAGVLLQNQDNLALGFGALSVGLLFVSMRHLSESLKMIAKAHNVTAWLFAVIIDLGIVLGELCHATGPSSLEIVSLGLVVGLAVMSAILNCFALTHHAKPVDV